MSDPNTCENEIIKAIRMSETNFGIGRSVSSARFQIAKVSNDDKSMETSLGKAVSIPNSTFIYC